MIPQLTEERAILYFPSLPMKIRLSGRKKPFEKFERFCLDNPDMRVELNKEGEILYMPPVHSESSEKNSEISYQLKHWAKKDKSGKVYESSGGFKLRNGAVRSPDASWILKERIEQLSENDRQGFMKICPDFVVELRSDTDSLQKLKAKMVEYLDNGAKLGWLIDPIKKKVHIYRQNKEPEILENPNTISGEDVLLDFNLDLSEIL
jgi:Uma2 family endonuclease